MSPGGGDISASTSTGVREAVDGDDRFGEICAARRGENIGPSLRDEGKRVEGDIRLEEAGEIDAARRGDNIEGILRNATRLGERPFSAPFSGVLCAVPPVCTARFAFRMGFFPSPSSMSSLVGVVIAVAANSCLCIRPHWTACVHSQIADGCMS